MKVVESRQPRQWRKPATCWKNSTGLPVPQGNEVRAGVTLHGVSPAHPHEDLIFPGRTSDQVAPVKSRALTSCASGTARRERLRRCTFVDRLAVIMK